MWRTCIIPQGIRSVLLLRFNSDLLNAYSDEAIWGVMEAGSVESVQEGRREAAGEQSADDVRDWVSTQGEDRGNYKTFAIIVC